MPRVKDSLGIVAASVVERSQAATVKRFEQSGLKAVPLSRKEIAADTGLSVRSVSYCLHLLSEMGLVRSENIRVRDGTVYTLGAATDRLEAGPSYVLEAAVDRLRTVPLRKSRYRAVRIKHDLMLMTMLTDAIRSVVLTGQLVDIDMLTTSGQWISKRVVFVKKQLSILRRDHPAALRKLNDSAIELLRICVRSHAMLCRVIGDFRTKLGVEEVKRMCTKIGLVENDDTTRVVSSNRFVYEGLEGKQKVKPMCTKTTRAYTELYIYFLETLQTLKGLKLNTNYRARSKTRAETERIEDDSEGGIVFRRLAAAARTEINPYTRVEYVFDDAYPSRRRAVQAVVQTAAESGTTTSDVAKAVMRRYRREIARTPYADYPPPANWIASRRFPEFVSGFATAVARRTSARTDERYAVDVFESRFLPIVVGCCRRRSMLPPRAPATDLYGPLCPLTTAYVWSRLWDSFCTYDDDWRRLYEYRSGRAISMRDFVAAQADALAGDGLIDVTYFVGDAAVARAKKRVADATVFEPVSAAALRSLESDLRESGLL